MTVVVATRGHVPSLSGSGVGVGVGEWGGGEKGGIASTGGPMISTNTAVDSRNKIKEIPDGVVLRKKKKSKHFVFKLILKNQITPSLIPRPLLHFQCSRHSCRSCILAIQFFEVHVHVRERNGDY